MLALCCFVHLLTQFGPVCTKIWIIVSRQAFGTNLHGLSSKSAKQDMWVLNAWLTLMGIGLVNEWYGQCAKHMSLLDLQRAVFADMYANVYYDKVHIG